MIIKWWTWSIHVFRGDLRLYNLSMEKGDKLTEEKIAEFKEAFQLFDKDNDNLVNISVRRLLSRNYNCWWGLSIRLPQKQNWLSGSKWSTEMAKESSSFPIFWLSWPSSCEITQLIQRTRSWRWANRGDAVDFQAKGSHYHCKGVQERYDQLGGKTDGGRTEWTL